MTNIDVYRRHDPVVDLDLTLTHVFLSERERERERVSKYILPLHVFLIHIPFIKYGFVFCTVQSISCMCLSTLNILISKYY